MKFENNDYVVEVIGGKVLITKKAFDDRYVCRIEDGKLRANSSLALAQGMKVRKIFGF